MGKTINGIQPTEWAKHLRPFGKRAFWKRHRKIDLMQELVEETERLGLYPWQESIVKSKHKKRFGLEHTFDSVLGSNYVTVDWYKTERAREEAFKNYPKSFWNRFQHETIKKVER